MDEHNGLKVAKPPRPEMTRHRRFGLFGWHLKMALGHLWTLLRGH